MEPSRDVLLDRLRSSIKQKDIALVEMKESFNKLKSLEDAVAELKSGEDVSHRLEDLEARVKELTMEKGLPEKLQLTTPIASPSRTSSRIWL